MRAMIAIEVLGGLVAVLMIGAVLFATGFWILLPILFLGVLMWMFGVINSAVH
jgi:hypothetical protein